MTPIFFFALCSSSVCLSFCETSGLSAGAWCGESWWGIPPLCWPGVLGPLGVSLRLVGFPDGAFFVGPF